MISEKVKKVTVEFESGEVKTYQLPTDQGFFRYRYTYTQDSHTDKITGKLHVFEIFWTLTEDQINGLTRKSQASTRTSNGQNP